MILTGLEKETLGTCSTVLQRLQKNGNLLREERQAVLQLQQYLRRLDNSMDMDSYNAHETTLDDSARAYLESFRERGHRHQYLLEHSDLVGESPPLRLHSFETAAGGNRELLSAMAQLESLHDFDVFKVAKASSGRPLETVSMALIQRYALIEKLALPPVKLASFLRAVESAYRPNPYHNSTHAADVVQSLAWLLASDSITRQLTDLELLCMIIAATVHDVGHPGVRNDFLVNLGTEAAVRYNDMSVNENGHAALAFETLTLQANNFVAHMSLDERRFFRRMVISIVLSTDMSVHDEQLKDLKSKVQEGGTAVGQWRPEAREVLLRYLVHTADITNPIRPRPLSQEWSRRIMQEFYAQGDRERGMGMPVSPLCDRETTDWPKSQAVFLDCVVRPIYETLAPLSPRAGAQAQETIDYTRDQWQANAAQLMAEHQAHAASTSPAAKPSAGVPRVPSDSVFSLDDVQ